MRSAIGVFLCLLSVFTPTSSYAQDSRGDFSCDDLIVAGAGPGGLYSAWRMIEAGLADPAKTCIFEQTQRIGKFETLVQEGFKIFTQQNAYHGMSASMAKFMKRSFARMCR